VNDLICYCFGYSVGDIQKDYKDNSKSTIMDKIQTEKKFGNCQCGIKNPTGKMMFRRCPPGGWTRLKTKM
jgi:hypothetical protein